MSVIIDKVSNEFANYVEINSQSIKITNYDLKYSPDYNLDSQYSKLFFFEYNEIKIFILNIYFDSSNNIFQIYPIDYKDIKFEIKIKFGSDSNNNIYWIFVENNIDYFIIKLTELCRIITTKFQTIKSYYSIYNTEQIYPTINKILLKYYKKKYCVILIGIDDFKITFNDDKEEWYKIDNIDDLLTNKELKIFRKKVGIFY